MKKILTSLAVAALAVPAWGASFTCEAFPAPGTVTALDQVIVDFPEYEEVEVISKSDVQVLFNGAEYTNFKVSEKDNSIVFTFSPAAVDAGIYNINLLPGSICGYADNYAVQDDLNYAIPFTYEIAGGSVEVGSFGYVADPAEGEVSEISTITVSFPAFEEIEINSKDDITATFNGASVPFSVKNTSYGSNAFLFTFNPELKDPGNLEVTFAAGSICGYDEEYNPNDLSEDLTLSYTLFGAKPVHDYYTYTLSPEAGQVESLSEVVFTFDQVQTIYQFAKEGVKVRRDKVALDASSYSVANNGNKVTFTFNPALDGEGTVDITINSNSILSALPSMDFVMNKNDIEVEYILVAPAEPVVYDLTFTKGTPQFKNDSNDGIITPDTSMDLFALRSPVFGLNAPEGVKVTLVRADGGYSEEATLRFNMQSNDNYFGVFTQFKAVFQKKPDVNGVYYLTVPQGSFGDAEWMANPETGHSNPEIVLEYILEGFKEPEEPIKYDLVPVSIEPAENTTVNSLETIVITFSERVWALNRGAIQLTNTENRYEATPSLSRDGSKEVTMTFAAAPTVYGEYSLIIPRGTFCNADYAETMEEGSLNDDIFITWTLDVENGVKITSVSSAEAPVYNMMGVKVADSLEQLPAGLYIRGGKKVVVK